MHESAHAGRADAHSAIHVTHEGRTSITEFFYEPGTPRPFGIFYDDPATGTAGVPPLRQPGILRRVLPEPDRDLTTYRCTAGAGGGAPARGRDPRPFGPGRSSDRCRSIRAARADPDNPSARTDNCGFCALSCAVRHHRRSDERRRGRALCTGGSASSGKNSHADHGAAATDVIRDTSTDRNDGSERARSASGTGSCRRRRRRLGAVGLDHRCTGKRRGPVARLSRHESIGS